MTASTGEDSYVGRRIDDLTREVRELSKDMLLREVYLANQMTVEMRLKALEDARVADTQDRGNNRRVVIGAIFAFVGSIVVQVFTFILMLTMR